MCNLVADASIAMAANRSLPRHLAVFSSAVLALATTSRQCRSAHGRSWSGALDAAASSSVESRTCDGAPNAGDRENPLMRRIFSALAKAANQTCDNAHNVP